jgi:hypothetical protein
MQHYRQRSMTEKLERHRSMGPGDLIRLQLHLRQFATSQIYRYYLMEILRKGLHPKSMKN